MSQQEVVFQISLIICILAQPATDIKNKYPPTKQCPFTLPDETALVRRLLQRNA
jgi:hypothetical protein